MPKYDDCYSCAFQGEKAICDICKNADQWEEADYYEEDKLSKKPQILHFSPKIKEAA